MSNRGESLMEKSVLFVDDEKQILKSIKRMFIDSDYKMFFAEGGRDALDILSNNQIDIVVSDMKMPEMDGYELLKKVKNLYPSAIRIILSGYSEEDIIYKAIHSNLVKLYIFKPWKADELKNTIDDIFKTQELLNNKNILDIINSIENLPTVPDTYIKLNNAIDRDLYLDGITKIIEDDPVVSSEILHIANTAFYGVKTGSIKNAILNLGLSNIKNIVLTSEIFNNCTLSGDEKETLWKHSSLTNKLLIEMYKSLLNKAISEDCYSAGLLHDIGKVLIVSNFPDQYKQLSSLKKLKSDSPDYELEKELFNISHNELGAYLLNWWEIPSSIVEVALFHDEPEKSTALNKEVVSMAHLANHYSWRIIDKDHFAPLDKNIFNYIGFTEESCENFIKSVSSEV
jgi:HD-like signal output (HDOD) protein